MAIVTNAGINRIRTMVILLAVVIGAGVEERRVAPKKLQGFLPANGPWLLAIRNQVRPRSAKISVGFCFPFTVTSPSRRVRYCSRAFASVVALIMIRVLYSAVF